MYEEIIQDAKNYLDITYEDQKANKKIEGIVKRGISYLNGVAGSGLDFAEETDERALLFDYCRYARSNALEEFETDFKSEIVSLKLRQKVRRYAEKKAGV